MRELVDRCKWDTKFFNDIDYWFLNLSNRYVVYMDANGDTQGNYTLIGRQLYESSNPEHLDIGLYPVGIFHIPHNHSTIPVSPLSWKEICESSLCRSIWTSLFVQELHLIAPIMWKAGRAPIDEPPCGFRGELCICKPTGNERVVFIQSLSLFFWWLITA